MFANETMDRDYYFLCFFSYTLMQRWLCTLQFRVDTAASHQLTVRPLFAHLAMLDDANQVGILDGRQTMRNYETCASRAGCVKGRLNHLRRGMI